MNRILFLLASMLLSFASSAQNETLMLWPAGKVPNSLPNDVEETTSHRGDILRIAGVTVPSMTAYLPAADKATGAAVMICPGGGYGILAADHEGVVLAEWFKQRGIAAFVLKYRLPNAKAMKPTHDAPLRDAMQGIRLIRQNAKKYRIHPDRIGVMGFSAGGHLAATLSTHFDRGPNASEEARPNFAMLIYPVITFSQDYQHGGSRRNLLGEDDTEEMARYYSNERMVSQTTPPTFLVHAADDKSVPIENSFDYFMALKANGIPAELHAYPSGGHGFGMRTEGKGSVAHWPAALEGWLKSRGLM